MGAVWDVIAAGGRSLRHVLLTGSAPPLPRATWWRGLRGTLVVLGCAVGTVWLSGLDRTVLEPPNAHFLAGLAAALTTALVLAAMSRPDRLWFLLHVTCAVPITLATLQATSDALLMGWNKPAWAVAVLTGAAVLLIARNALTAWRLTIVVALLGPFLSDSGLALIRVWGWPWPQGVVLAMAAAVAAVAVRCAPNEQIAVWAVSCVPLFVHSRISDALLGATLLAVVMVVANTVRLRRSVREQFQLTERERTRRAVLEERGRIARELHDVVAHHMSVLAVRSDSAPYRYPGLPDEVSAEFGALNATAREGLTEMRRLLGVLRGLDDEDTAPQPGIAEIGDLVDRVRATGAEIDLTVEDTPTGVPTGVGLSAYRIVQEALSNATTHAPGAPVRVEVRRVDDALVVRVVNGRADAPVCEAPSDRSRHGLLGMRERVGLFGGRLAAGPTPDGGFTVAATIPLEEAR